MEKQQRQQSMEDTNSKYTFLDPSKTHRIYNPTLKAFQKKAIQSYFQRQQQTSQSNRSSISNINDLTDDSLGENSFHLNKTPSIGTEKLIFENETLPNTPNSKILKGVKKVEPPPTPPRNRSIPLRRFLDSFK